MLKKLKKILSRLGPGFITGAADDDPSGIATYSQAGAQFGYTQLWTALFSFPFMTVIQEMCGRIGMVTGKGLSGVIRIHYSKKILYFSILLLLIANTINIGADLGAMASSAELLIPLPFVVLLLIITALSLILEVFVSYKVYSKILKYLTFSLFSYIIVAFVVKQDWSRILTATFIPAISFNRDYFLNIVAILGTTISPYLFFWQSDEEVEEEVEFHKIRAMGRGVPKITAIDIKKMRIDTLVGMFFSQLVMFFIIVTTASTLAAKGINNINTATDAAEALRPIAGNFTFFLFGVGVIGTGLLAVPVLAGSASYAISEAFGWKEGLYRKFKQAHGFYGIITIATVLGLLVNFTGIPPFKILYYTAVLNGIVAPPLMVLILLISNNSKIMGKYKSNTFSNIAGWAITLVMTFAAFALLLSFFSK
ncbi:MAG: Nramp family divalent metal transporter [Candidatus Curtissbacteria bacterium]|nr:Nramp family divalent metal transporter [Candidatus Curtissbacteria bacterium]